MSDQQLPADPAVPRHEPSRIDPRLLEILVCPFTKTTLEYDSARQELVSRAMRLAFPIKDGIPILIEDEARQIEEPPAP